MVKLKTKGFLFDKIEAVAGVLLEPADGAESLIRFAGSGGSVWQEQE